MKENLTQAAFEAEVELAAKEAAIQFPAYLDMVERKVAAWKVNYSSGAAATAGVPSAEITMESSDTQSTPLGQASGGQNPDGMVYSQGVLRATFKPKEIPHSPGIQEYHPHRILTLLHP